MNDFARATDGGLTPFLFKNLLPIELRGASEIERCWRLMQDEKVLEATGVRARLYIEEARKDVELAEVLAAPVSRDDDLSGVVLRVTGAHKFMFAVNNFERLSPQFAAAFGEFIQSMIACRGAPLGGCEQVVFAGNYSGTAFGIHEGYEHAFLVHLGPGTKDFYCWSRETYLTLTNGDRAPTFGDYEAMLAHGQHFKMEAGDVLYLPALVYHVGRQTEYSVSIAVPLYTYPIERYLTRAVLPNLCDRSWFDVEGRSPHIPVGGEACPLKEAVMPCAEELFRRWLASDLSELLSVAWLNLVSNGFWEPADRFAAGPAGVEPNAGQPMIGVRLLGPYKICWRSGLLCGSSDFRVFLKGKNIVLPESRDLEEAFHRLNGGAIIELRSASKAVVRAMEALVKTGGLKIE